MIGDGFICIIGNEVALWHTIYVCLDGGIAKKRHIKEESGLDAFS